MQARGEACRLTMVIGKIPFDDKRVSPKDFPEFRKKTPLSSLPVAEIDGQMVAQSNAILRYFGCLTNMYPEDAKKGLIVDQVIDTVADFSASILRVTGDTEEEKRKARTTAVQTGGERYFGGAQRMVEAQQQKNESEGPYLFGDKPTIADVSIAAMYIFLKTGVLDHIQGDELDSYSTMKKIFKSIIAIPEVVDYLKEHPVPGVEV